MSHRSRSSRTTTGRGHATVFAALGDKTRLLLVAKLSSGQPRSISQLTEGTRLTRQAITKHLRVLETVGMVHRVRKERESLYAFNPAPIEEAKGYLDMVGEQWDQTLARLKLEKGDSLYITEGSQGIRLVPFDEGFALQMEAAREVMRENRDVLQRLAE